MSSEGVSRKIWSRAQSVEGACILFSLNTEPQHVLQLAKQLQDMGLRYGKSVGILEGERLFCHHWYAFVHASIVSRLMVVAPNSVLVDYLRQTTTLLAQRHIPKREAKFYVDTYFSPYMDLLAKEEQKYCPQLFLKSVYGFENVMDVPPRALALLSGTMAMLLSAVADKLDQYDMQVD